MTSKVENLKHLKINIKHLKGHIREIIEKEKLYLAELTHIEKDEEILKNEYLEFCRIEDKLFFETKIEYKDLKYSKELQELFYDDFN